MAEPRIPHPLWALTRTRLLEFVREPGALFWVFIFPVLLAIGLGIAFRSAPPERARVAVTRDTPGAKRLFAELKRSKGMRVVLLSAVEADSQLRRGKIDLVIAPPSAKEKAKGVRFRYRYDATRAEAKLARLAVDDALQKALGRRDVAKISDDTRTRAGGRYIDFLIPGLIGLNLMGSGMWGIGFVVVQARTRKLLKRFAATPMRRSHYLLSYMLSRLSFLVFEVGILIAFGWLAFDVAIRGSILAVASISILGALSFTGLALLVAARPQSIEAASGWMNFVMLPMWVLSGAFFSYERFPDAVHPALQALPLTALNDALRAVINDGATLWSTWPQLLNLFLWGVVSFAIALRIFRWK